MALNRSGCSPIIFLNVCKEALAGTSVLGPYFSKFLAFHSAWPSACVTELSSKSRRFEWTSEKKVFSKWALNWSRVSSFKA